MRVNKDKLKFKKRYSWQEGNDSPSRNIFFGDHLIFDRHDGDHVLHLIRKIDTVQDFHNPLSSEEIETLLIFLPDKELTHSQVRKWISLNRNKYRLSVVGV